MFPLSLGRDAVTLELEASFCCPEPLGLIGEAEPLDPLLLGSVGELLLLCSPSSIERTIRSLADIYFPSIDSVIAFIVIVTPSRLSGRKKEFVKGKNDDRKKRNL